MKNLNEISRDIYGKNYSQLPDDGAEQDHVQNEYARQFSGKAADEAVEWLKNDAAYLDGKNDATAKHSRSLAIKIENFGFAKWGN